MDKVSIIGKMGIGTKDNFHMISDKDLESIFGAREDNIKASGKPIE